MNKRTEFLFYAYYPPYCGTFKHNGVEYRYGEDFRNAKRYKEYHDCGFDVLQARYENAFNGGEWEGSNCQRVFKEGLKGGCDKILVTDERFDGWIKENNLIGEGKRFANEKDLDKAVAEYVAPYCNQEGFYGIQLLDEPRYENIPAYGQLVQSLKRVLPNAQLQCNLSPAETILEWITPKEGQALENSTATSLKVVHECVERYNIYEKYVNDFIDATGLDYVLFDVYPFRKKYIIHGNAIANYQIIAKICQKRNLEFRVVLQSFAHVSNGNHFTRRVTESDMYWQTNMALGFGAREFSFFTYMTRPIFSCENSYTGESFFDGAGFLNLDGSKTALYTYTKRIIKEMKKFSRIALNYDYQSSYIIAETGKNYQDFDWTKYIYEDEKSPIDICVNKGVSLVTRSTNGENELYMIENIGNIKDELFDNVPPMQVKVKFPSGNKNFYFRGKKIVLKPDYDGAYTFSLKVGDAVFAEIKE